MFTHSYWSVLLHKQRSIPLFTALKLCDAQCIFNIIFCEPSHKNLLQNLLQMKIAEVEYETNSFKNRFMFSFLFWQNMYAQVMAAHFNCLAVLPRIYSHHVFNDKYVESFVMRIEMPQNYSQCLPSLYTPSKMKPSDFKGSQYLHQLCRGVK